MDPAELQRNLEIDEQEMNITAGRAAIITALERESLSPIEREFVIRYAKNTPLEGFLNSKNKKMINVAGKMRLNEWKGKKNIDFMIEDISIN